MKITAEEFLRNKLVSEIESFGDGTTEFHTRDIGHLIKCLDDKDECIKELRSERGKFISEINFDVKKHFNELLTLCMERSNWSAEQRLNYIRNKYKELYDTLIQNP